MGCSGGAVRAVAISLSAVFGSLRRLGTAVWRTRWRHRRLSLQRRQWLEFLRRFLSTLRSVWDFGRNRSGRSCGWRWRSQLWWAWWIPGWISGWISGFLSRPVLAPGCQFRSAVAGWALSVVRLQRPLSVLAAVRRAEPARLRAVKKKRCRRYRFARLGLCPSVA